MKFNYPEPELAFSLAPVVTLGKARWLKCSRNGDPDAPDAGLLVHRPWVNGDSVEVREVRAR